MPTVPRLWKFPSILPERHWLTKPPETSPLPPDTSIQVSGRGCPSAHPASFLCTSMLVLQPPSELPRTLSKNAFSSQLSQRWLSRLQGMPEKKWASLDLKPRCPNLDPWVEAIKLKTGEWSNVKIPGDVQSAGTRARERSRPGRRILSCALTRTPQAPSLHRTSLSAHEGPVWVLWHFSLRLSSQRASEPQLEGMYNKESIFGDGTCSSICGASWVFCPKGHWDHWLLRPQAVPFHSCQHPYSACASLPVSTSPRYR